MSETQSSGYSAKKPGSQLVEFKYTLPPLKPNEVRIKITHCGICHSDLHLIDNDWKVSEYPLIPGHEIIGLISEIGGQVKNFKLGQRVGIGWQRSACKNCEPCLSGSENLCFYREATCVANHGGFSKIIQFNSDYVFDIPQSLKSAEAAPLLCGGITVFAPLKRHSRPHHQVAILGVGGLGHLAIQFASKMGCEVTVFSTSASKKAECLALGASHFILLNQNEIPKNKFNVILSTSHMSYEVEPILESLKIDGVLCFLGVPDEKIQFPVASLLRSRRVVTASSIGNPNEMREMLNFAALHKIQAICEKYPLNEVNQAIEKLRKNQIRYRAVLEI